MSRFSVCISGHKWQLCMQGIVMARTVVAASILPQLFFTISQEKNPQAFTRMQVKDKAASLVALRQDRASP